jgi:hypothetical protein
MLKEINHKSGTQQALDRVAETMRAGKWSDDVQEFMPPPIARSANPAWRLWQPAASSRIECCEVQLEMREKVKQ